MNDTSSHNSPLAVRVAVLDLCGYLVDLRAPRAIAFDSRGRIIVGCGGQLVEGSSPALSNACYCLLFCGFVKPFAH